MPNVFIVGLLFIVLLIAAPFGHGHQQTERYIPVGQSPGLSGKFTSIGVIEAIDPQGGMLTLSSSTVPVTVIVTENTRIWLDRSQLKQTTATGLFTDLQTGRKIEVKYEDDKKRRFAEWIKIEITAPTPAVTPSP